MNKPTLFLLQIFFSTYAWSTDLSEIKFGPEWTFTNKRILTSAVYENEQYLREIANTLEKFCKESGKCKITNEDKLKTRYFDSIKIMTRFGSEISFSVDPGVIEVTATPLTLSEWKEHHNEFQHIVFDLLNSMGLSPHEREGAGHLNIGLQVFEDKPLLARNFLVDFLNHPGVGVVLNSLEANRLDAAYLHDWIELTEDRWLRSVIPTETVKRKLWLDKLLSHQKSSLIPRNLSEALQQFMSYSGSGKFVAIGIRDFEKKELARFEVRTLRPQASMIDFIKVMEIYQARIQFLSQVKKVLPLEKPYPITDGWQALGEFAQYLSESGLNWKEYRTLMPPPWKNLPESNFVFKRKKVSSTGGNKMCSKILTFKFQ